LSSLRIYKDQASILTFEFKYQDGTSYTTGSTTTQFDDFALHANECLVKIEQTMDMDQTHDGDGSGHRRRVVLVTSSGRTFTSSAGGSTANSGSNVLEATQGKCITKAHTRAPGHWANALKDMELSDCRPQGLSLSLLGV